MKRNAAAWFIALIGGGIILTELCLHWWASFHNESYPIGAWPVLVGAAIAFTGGYIRDPKAAEDGGGFIVNTGLRIMRVIRTGNADEITVARKDGQRAGDTPGTEVTTVTEVHHEGT